jgi:hypothetical protein
MQMQKEERNILANPTWREGKSGGEAKRLNNYRTF